MAEQDNQYMQRAIELATRGLGYVAPNPMVGCVIVNKGKIIGEGWHKKYGDAHAEVNAVKSAGDQSLEGATIYVNMEPCSYFGNTPPCANMITDLPVKRVVFSHIDPNPRVSGSGAEIIRNKGIEVTNGVLEQEARALNKRFLTYHEKLRPFIILKWAQTTDGFIARKNYDSKWISNEYSRKLVHRWRSEEPGIMVGKNTVHYDNPALTVRDWQGTNPSRIIIDPNAKLDGSQQVFDGQIPSLYYHKDTNEPTFKFDTSIALNPENFIQEVLKDLKTRQIQSVLIEGGGHLLDVFISLGIWDEARVFISPSEFGEGIKAPIIKGEAVKKETVMGDQLLYFTNHIYG